MKKSHFWIGLFAVAMLASYGLCAQTDSVAPLLKRLTKTDLSLQEDSLPANQVWSVLRRVPVAADDLPFDMYIISKDEIQRHNCITLADALKYLPGGRVSQPGNALLGETFLVNGLLGNEYTQILINDIPIKPGNTAGMPIGAQLPIRQAERIEVIYGPAADAYGGNTAAGVINIILQESERPAYVEANLFAGALGYNDINISFGGKIGDSRKGFRYRLYGSHTRANDRKIVGSIAMDLNYYPIDSASLVNNPNYTQEYPFNIAPFMGRMPYESRQLGLDLAWRRISISLSQHYRQDHSALGYNPGAVSYSDDGTFTGENTTQITGTYSLRFWKKINWRFSTTVGSINSNPQSSILYVNTNLSRQINKALETIAGNDPVLRDSFQRYAFERYFSNRRYFSVSDFSIRAENLLTYSPKPWLHLMAGNIIYTSDVSYEYFGTRPFYDNQTDFSYDGNPYYLFGSAFQSNMLGQVFIHTSSFSLFAGANWYTHTHTNNFWYRNFRLAGQYKITPQLRVRFSRSTAINYYPWGYAAQNFRGYNYEFTIPFDRMNIENIYDRINILPEESSYMDAGIHWLVKNKLDINLNWRKQQMVKLVAVTDLSGSVDPELDLVPLQMYSNQSGSLTWQSVQLNLSVRELGKHKDSHTSLYVQYGVGQEVLADGQTTLPFVRQLPTWMIQSNTFIRLSRRAFVQVNQQFLTGMYHASVKDPALVGSQAEQYYQKPFHAIDIIGHFRITDNVDITAKMINATQTSYSGLGAGGPDDLIFNPQRGRVTTFGLSYRMN